MLIEKARRDDELVEILEKIIPMTKENEIADMISIIRYILKRFRNRKSKKVYKKIRRRNKNVRFCKLFKTDRERAIMEGEKLGEKRGKLQEAIRLAKNMLREKIDIETIERITSLSRKQFM